ncbi:minor capsid protein [Brevibacillus brevis]|uniref:minor capsid protein n=1 Tax=Brevibacillus brevis TaxID=1393 RepID=UPI000D0F48EF|nr:minor capsid protein [Brevibacillus brevis]PSJ67448.1 hypothetical protein C7J99_20875 [Brevibacillus brevis]RED28434.1 hypothetical protein DES34_108301 [Brevibacillus brevis]GEC90688.1 hypothetical protein BBR01nite_30190 [Brevibacillus brevis]VEF91129.1 Uncharacterised protein [Brevibacillus brevis]
MEINKIIKKYLVSKGYNEKEIFLNARPARECISVYSTPGGEPENGLCYPGFQINVKRKDGAYEEIQQITKLLHKIVNATVSGVKIRGFRILDSTPYKLTEEDGCFVYIRNFRLIVKESDI